MKYVYILPALNAPDMVWKLLSAALFHLSFWMILSGDSLRNFEENMSNFVISDVPADDLAP